MFQAKCGIKRTFVLHHLFLTAPVSSSKNQTWRIIIILSFAVLREQPCDMWLTFPSSGHMMFSFLGRHWRWTVDSSLKEVLFKMNTTRHKKNHIINIMCGRRCFVAYRNLSPWNMHPCDPGRRHNPDFQHCCFFWVSSGDVWLASCCCCRRRHRYRPWLLCRPFCWPASCASCSWTDYCFWTGCGSTAAASSLKRTGWPWTACPEWPPVYWEMQVADCKYVNKKYTTTQPLHGSQCAGRGEERESNKWM